MRRVNSGRFGASAATSAGVLPAGALIPLHTGLGLRLAWEFLVVRFDLATRLHDPAPHEREGVVLQPHFGIGHTF